MAVTIATDWQLQAQGQIASGSLVLDGAEPDLRDLAQLLHKAFAQCVHTVASWGVYSTQRYVDESGGVVYQARADHYIRHWGASGRFRLHAYGQNCVLRATVGTRIVGVVTCAGALAWYSGATTLLAGIVRDADGFAFVDLDARGTGAGTQQWGLFVLEEIPIANAGGLPDKSDTDTDFQRLDDEVGQADRCLDGWLCQSLWLNARELRRCRARGTARVWPLVEPITHSSVNRRCEGPWVYPAAPGEDWAIVCLYVEATTKDLVVSVFSEHEQEAMGDVLDTTGRAQTVTAGAGKMKLVFKGIALRSYPGQITQNRLWIYWESDNDALAATAYSPTAFLNWRDAGYCPLRTDQNDWYTGEPVDWPVGRAILNLQYEYGVPQVGGNAAQIKALRDGDISGRLYDLSHNKAGDLLDSIWEIWVSPSPRLVPPYEMEPGTSTIATYEIGVLSIYSCWIGADYPELPDATDLHNAAQVEHLPSVAPIEEARQILNDMVQYASPLVGCSMQGQRWLRTTTLAAPLDMQQRGRYVFYCIAASSQEIMAEWPLPSAPVSGTGLNVEQLQGGGHFFVISEDAASANAETATIRWQLWHSGGAGIWLETVVPVVYLGDLESVSQIDAAAAAQCLSYDFAANLVYEHSYVQQSTLLAEVFADLWLPIPPVEVSLPAAFPTTIELRASNLTLSARAWVVCTGAFLHYGDRQ